MGVWSDIIGTLEGILVACGGLGVAVGLCLKATAAHDESKHSFSHTIIGSSLTGLLIGLLAQDIGGMFIGWI